MPNERMSELWEEPVTEFPSSLTLDNHINGELISFKWWHLAVSFFFNCRTIKWR